MTKSQKFTLLRIFLSAALLAFLMLCGDMLPALWYVKAALFLIPYLLIGYDTLLEALGGLFRGQMLDENFLMSVASVGAFAIGEYPEAVAVMLFNAIGELFEEYAVGRSRKSIAALMDIRPDHAVVERDGKTETVDPDEVKTGEIIVILAGERIPLDGVIIDGATSVDTAALTGEAIPRNLDAGDEVISGTVNLSGKIRVRVTAAFGESTVARILDLVENASAKKAKTEKFISRFAHIYTPVVVGAAILLAVIPSLLTGDWSVWIYRALSFLVTSCPCALVISVPLGFFGGIGVASKHGILVKGGNYMEALSRLETVVFDKTGTLTRGTFRVTELLPAENVTKEELLTIAAYAESGSHHPIARSLREALGKDIDESRIASITEESGKGLRAVIDGTAVLVGSEKLMQTQKIDFLPSAAIGTVVYVAVDGAFLGAIVIADEPKADAKEAIAALKQIGVGKTVMLTGDNEKTARAIGEALALDEIHAGLLPADKVDHVEALLKGKSPRKTLAFVGDGINDAPVLSRADLGISMGQIGSDAAVEASDIVLMDDSPMKISTAVKIAKKTMRIVSMNIILALAVKLGVLLLVATGVLGMWAAVFADVGVSVLAILNAMRIFKTKI